MSSKPNRLIHESSPYLLQHAHNPVDWYPWGTEALEAARRLNRPILVSIGYAACHWCHVMEKESFEDPVTAEIMNRDFINIKIDREERPDLDHIYMDAVQAMSGSGGWPLNVFLTPEAKPFYGGTYFPPKPVADRPSWKDVLAGVANAFAERKPDIETQAENLTAHIRQSNEFGLQQPGAAGYDFKSVFDRSHTEEMFSNIMKMADRQWGGFGRAPKFPQTFIIRFLLQYYWHHHDETALRQASLSIDKMICGGIYDQLGGGFARYATDMEWLVPHFEKMLYDNALLLQVICEAYQLTGSKLYAKTIRHTIEWIEREMKNREGGFYSALDADSEGEEGRYYVWQKSEIDSVLGDDSSLFCQYYDVSEKGNWEHKNILNVKVDPGILAGAHGLTLDLLESKMTECREKLFEKRSGRARPLLDDKSILGWNAMMCTALFKAAAVLGDENYKAAGIRSLEFILRNFDKGDGSFWHCWKNGEGKHPAFLDDYACLIDALIVAQELTADAAYLLRAREILDWVIEGFSEPASGFFYFTHTNQQDVIVRKKEIYDGATAAGNSMMAINLYYLGVVFDKSDWRERAFRLCAAVQPVVTRYPSSFGVWATLMQGIAYGIPEIVLMGEKFRALHRDFLLTFTPLKIFQVSPSGTNDFPLLSGKPETKESYLYLCKNYTCQTPVTEVNALIRQLESV